MAKGGATEGSEVRPGEGETAVSLGVCEAQGLMKA